MGKTLPLSFRVECMCSLPRSIRGSEVLGAMFEEEYVCILHASKGINLAKASLQGGEGCKP